MQNGRQRIEFVQAWHDSAIFDVCQAADVQDEVRTATIDGNLIAGALDVAICQPELLWLAAAREDTCVPPFEESPVLNLLS